MHASMIFSLLIEVCFLFQMRLEVSVDQPYPTHAASLPADLNWAVGPRQPLHFLYA